MNKHTPGPWQQFDDGGRIIDKHTYGPEYADVVWGPNGPGRGPVADCSPHGRADEESIANARLIAVAPDLLAVCEATLDYWQSTDFADCDPGCVCIVDQMRTAVAKAYGQK